MDIRFRCVCPFMSCSTFTTPWYETAQRATMALATHFLKDHNKAIVRMGRPGMLDSEVAMDDQWPP